jgi:uncharacterized delta-60 repeat protein
MNRFPHWRFALAAVPFAVTASVGAASPPLPDLAWGGSGDGIARIAAADVPASSGYATHAIVQPDGGVVLIGTASASADEQAVLMRFDAQGLPDAAFGPAHDGFYRTLFAGSGDDVAQTADGKLAYAAHASGFDAMLVGRLDADGVPDTSFFGSGRRLIGPSALMDDATQGYLGSLQPQPDGGMLAFGFIVVSSTPAQYFSCAMRLLPDGATDTGFGSSGRTCIASTPSPAAASQALVGTVLADGRILLAGASRHPGGSGWDMSVARLDANGLLDASFGPDHDGWAFVGFDQGGTMSDGVQAVAVDGSGRLLLAGFLEGVNGTDIGIARLLPDGQPDVSFGTQGRVQVTLDLGGFDNERAYSITALPDGGILAGGPADTDGWSIGVAILLDDAGQLDPRFGDGGVFLQASPSAPQTAKVESLQQILAGDHLYMIGDSLNAASRLDFAVTRSVLPLFVDGFDHRPVPPVPSRGDERNQRELPKAKERTP